MNTLTNSKFKSQRSKLRIFFFSTSLILFSIAVSAYAQPAWRWGQTGTGLAEGQAIATDNAGNIYGAGINFSGTGATFGSITVPGGFTGAASIWVKYNAAGTPLWADGTRGGSAQITAMATDPAGNLVVFGMFSGDTMHIGSFALVNVFYPGGYQYFLAKISPAGAVLWAVNDGHIYLNMGAVTTDDSGNIYIAGMFEAARMHIGTDTLINFNTAGTSPDIYVAKYTPSGALAWAASAGGINYDYVTGATVPSSGDLYITGYTASPSMAFGTTTIGSPSPLGRAYIARYSSAGTPMWARAAGQATGATGEALAHDDAGNIYMTGTFEDSFIVFGTDTLQRTIPSSILRRSSFLVKYSPIDSLVWGRGISAAAENVDAYSVSTSACGKVWMGGSGVGQLVFGPGDTLLLPSTTDPAFIAGYDFSGVVAGYNLLSSGGDDISGVACDPTGNVYFCGDFFGTPFTVGPDTFTSTVPEQFFVAKYGYAADTLPSVVDAAVQCGVDTAVLLAPPGISYFWDDGETTQTRGPVLPGNYWVTVLSCGDTVITDTFHVTHQPSPAPIAGPDYIVNCEPNHFTDSLGGGIWSSSADSLAIIDSVTGFATLMGEGSVTITYTVGGCSVTKTVAVHFCEGAVHSVPGNTSLLVSPNPTTDYFTIQTSPNTYTSCTLINNLGQVVITQPIVATQTRVDVGALPAGTYYLRLTGEGDTRVVRVVKE